MSVSKQILAPSPIISVTRQSVNVTVYEKVPYQNIRNRMLEVFPPNTATTFYKNEIDPVFGICVAQSFEASPMGNQPMVDGTGSDVIDHVSRPGLYPHGMKVTINYSTDALEDDELGTSVSFDENDDPVLTDTFHGLTHSITSGAEYITFDEKIEGLEWLSGDSAKGTHAGFVVPTQEHQFTWHRVVNPPWEELNRRIGCLNSDKKYFNTGAVYPETMLLLSYESMRNTQSNGKLCWDLTFRLSERNINYEKTTELDPEFPGGWNHFYNSKTGYFERLLGPTGQPIYQKLNFFSDTPSLFRVVDQVD